MDTLSTQSSCLSELQIFEPNDRSLTDLMHTYLIKYINNKTGYWPLSELCLPNIQQEQPPKGAKGIISSLSTLNTTIVLTWIG